MARASHCPRTMETLNIARIALLDRASAWLEAADKHIDRDGDRYERLAAIARRYQLKAFNL